MLHTDRARRTCGQHPYATRARTAPHAVALLLTLGAAPALQAQATTTLVVGAGTFTDARGVRGSAANVAPTLALSPDPRLRVTLGAHAARFHTADWTLGGSGAFALRQPIGAHLAVALDGAAARSATSFDARYDAASLVPSVEGRARIGRAALLGYAGATLATGATTVRVATAQPTPERPPLPLLGAPAQPQRQDERTLRAARTARGAVAGAVATFANVPAAPSLGYREARVRVGAVDVVDRSLSLGARLGRLALGAGAGARTAPDERATFAHVGATLDLGRALALQGAAGRYPSDRVSGALGGRFASLGLVLRHASAAPTPAMRPTDGLRGAPPLAPGVRRLVIRLPHARRVELAGDWSHRYSREQAVYPVPGLKTDKFWPAVKRVDNAAGDRQLVCTCPPMEAYTDALEQTE